MLALEGPLRAIIERRVKARRLDSLRIFVRDCDCSALQSSCLEGFSL